MIVRHVEGSFDGEPPLAAEIALGTRFGLCRYERHEEVAIAYLPADLLVPGVAAVEPTFVVPDLEAACLESVPDALRRRPIFRGIAEEDRRRPAGGFDGVIGGHADANDPASAAKSQPR